MNRQKDGLLRSDGTTTSFAKPAMDILPVVSQSDGKSTAGVIPENMFFTGSPVTVSLNCDMRPATPAHLSGILLSRARDI